MPSHPVAWQEREEARLTLAQTVRRLPFIAAPVGLTAQRLANVLDVELSLEVKELRGQVRKGDNVCEPTLGEPSTKP